MAARNLQGHVVMVDTSCPNRAALEACFRRLNAQVQGYVDRQLTVLVAGPAAYRRYQEHMAEVRHMKQQRQQQQEEKEGETTD